MILALAADEPTARQWLDHWRALPQLRAVRQHQLVGFVDARLSRLGPAAVDATEQLCARLAVAAPDAPAAPAVPSAASHQVSADRPWQRGVQGHAP